MRTRIEKRGRDVGVRIPSSIAKNAGLKPGLVVSLHVRGVEIRVRAVRSEVLSLSTLLAGVTTRNLHGAISDS